MIALYSPPDVAEQNKIWGANCGPSALAAILGRTVASLRETIATVQCGAFKGYMHAGHLCDVLRACGREVRRRDFRDGKQIRWPRERGLVVVQIDGPWCEPGVNPKARFRYTHTVAVEQALGSIRMVYDGNARMWLQEIAWEYEIMRLLIRDQPRATGWYTSTVIEVKS